MTDNSNKLSADEICLLVSSRIKGTFPDSPVAYFDSVKGRFDDDGNFFIIVPDSFSASRFESKFRRIVEDILLQFCNIESFSVKIDPSIFTEKRHSEPVEDNSRPTFIQRGSKQTEINSNLPSVASKSHTNSPGSSVSGLNPKYTMDSFIVGDSNKFPHAVSIAVIASPGVTYNPLFFYGGSGLGKTHLMQAIGHALTENGIDSGRVVEYRTSEVFGNEYIEAIKKNKLETFRKKYREAGALLIDDVHFFCGKEKMLEEFHHTFNELYQSGRQIVMTSDINPSHLRDMPERLISRFKSGIVTEIRKPDLETRIAILNKLATDYSINPSYECLESIAKRVTTNIRDLEGAFTKVAAMSSVMNVPFSVSMVDEVLSDFARERQPRIITLSLVKDMVCQHFSVSKEELIGKRRPRRIVIPRQIAMYLSYVLTDSTYQAIGASFGGRDHTTVVHACNKMEIEATKETSVAEDIRVLRIKLKETVDR